MLKRQPRLAAIAAHWRPYVIAALALLVATLVREAIDPLLGLHHAYILYIAAVAVVAWCGGSGPALLVTAAGAVLGTTLFAPPSSAEWIDKSQHVAGLIVYLGVSGLLVGLIGSLHRAREAAEAASRTKSQFLATMSHEIRTPMTAILGMTDLALDETTLPDVREYLQTARGAGRTLLALLDDILDLARIEAGRLELEHTGFGLRTVVREATKELAVRAQAKGLELICDLPSTVPDALVGDPLRLKQVLVNLLGNAVKFTERGEVVVRVSSAEAPRGRVQLALAVADTGIGIDPEHQKAVFAPFKQGDASTTRRFGGSGLGLAITTSLVRTMHGRIELESRLGEGTTITVHVPLDMAPGGQAPSLRPEICGKLRGRPALVVVSCPSLASVIAGMLTHWSIEPEIVADGRAAADRIERGGESAYCLAVVDDNLADADGCSLACSLHGSGRLGWPTIVLTEPADRRCKDGRIRCGLRCLAKPVFESDLAAAVEDILRAGPAPSPETAAPPAAPASRNLKILLAEDNPLNRNLLQRLLAKRGHRVSAAENGREALRRLTAEPFDLVIMDVQMPLMDGLEATGQIRALADPGRARVPIIALTAHAMQGDRARCLAAGMDAYLTKPVDAEQLDSVIQALAATLQGA